MTARELMGLFRWQVAMWREELEQVERSRNRRLEGSNSRASVLFGLILNGQGRLLRAAGQLPAGCLEEPAYRDLLLEARELAAEVARLLATGERPTN